MSAHSKKLTVGVEDETKTELVEQITVHHFSDLGDGVKEVIEDFIQMNEGAVFPPVSIEVKESSEAGGSVPKKSATGQ